MTTAHKHSGYFALVLHAHLPWVLHHGTWPHGLEWLLETAAETYLPLLRMARTLKAEGIPFAATVSLSPVLLEQLAHAEFAAEFPRYLERKFVAAQEDEAFFQQAQEPALQALAQSWSQLYSQALHDFRELDGDLVGAFRSLLEGGDIEVITSAATHGYAPLLGTDESLSAQFATATRVHRRFFASASAGVWLPECGYRPGGDWKWPTRPSDGSAQGETYLERIGTETALKQNGLRFTIADTHTVSDAKSTAGTDGRLLPVYAPYCIGNSGVAVLARDPVTAFQVWSTQNGYPGDFNYLDFHKKRWPGGHRYWKVTGVNLGMESKAVYDFAAAESRAKEHARHFVSLLQETLADQAGAGGAPPILCAPFDLELFGHWWHEGMLFLENVFREIAATGETLRATTCGSYLQQFPPTEQIAMDEGSWGAGGDNSVWMNAETTGLYGRIYAAELQTRAVCDSGLWQTDAKAARIAKQLCREMLLLESSDWPTLITTGAARDYAERRFAEHSAEFAALLECWQQFQANGALNDAQEACLMDAERRDDLFADIDPGAWRTLEA